MLAVLAVRVVRVGECGEEMGVIVTREHLNSSQDKKTIKISDTCDVHRILIHTLLFNYLGV